MAQERSLARTGGVAAGEQRRAGLAAAGGVLGAVLSSSCCILPLVLFLLGAGGSWIGTLTSLAPYQPYFMIPTVALLGYGFWHVYGRPAGCAAEGACARSPTRPLVRFGLWFATLLVAAAATFNWYAPWLLG